jgi:hypothetical protein
LVPWGLDFCPWVTMLVIHGSAGTPEGTPWGPGLDFHRFLIDLGIHLGVNFDESACFFWFGVTNLQCRF